MSEYTFRRAIRAEIPLLVGLAGGTGAGKTKSMLELLKGMTPPGKRFAVIDTENGRARHYAGEYDFDYVELHDFKPDSYADAIEAADQAGYAAIGVDSMSHEWTEGVLGWQEEEWAAKNHADSHKMLSWIKPKTSHKRLIASLLQRRAHVVLAFRAEPKTEMAKENGRTVVRTKEGAGGYEGWFPITDSRLHFELTVYLMLLAEQPGKPKPIKLYDSLKAIFPDNRVITADAGRQLAEWARGGTSQPEAQRGSVPAPADRAPSDTAGQGPDSGEGASQSRAPEPRGESGPGPTFDAFAFSEMLKAATLTVSDLRPLIGPVTRDNWQLAVTAWLIANPDKGIRDLIAEAVPPAPTADAEQGVFP